MEELKRLQPQRVAGVLFGLAAGDRIGGPLRMALCLADSLIEKRGFEAEHVFETYSAWYFNGGFDTGPTAQEVFHKVKHGSSIVEAVHEVHQLANGLTAGCNPMHRAIVLALSPHIADDALADMARHEARLTHHHPLAGEVSAQNVMLCRRLVQGTDLDTVLAQIDLYDWMNRPLSNSGFSPDVFNAAVHFVRESISFETALIPALGFAGPDNYCPVVVGALAGAIYGRDQITSDLLEHCMILDRVAAVSDAFINVD